MIHEQARSYFDYSQRERQLREQHGIRPALMRHMRAAAVTVAALFLAYLAYCADGLLRDGSPPQNVIDPKVTAETVIIRDERGVPHVRAADDGDAFFAEGFAQASDRLVQMDLLRRYAYGRISEVVGPIQLSADESMRYLDVRDIAARQWAHLSAGERTDLEHFADGVNAAMRVQPLPFEFRFFLYEPQPWRAQDSLAVAMAVSAALDDGAENVLARDEYWRRLGRERFNGTLPLSDPRYDVTITGAMNPRRRLAGAAPASVHLAAVHLHGEGSNAWAAGGARTLGGRALVANDPHLDLSVPGIWYLIEIHSRRRHVAGATIPGIPGVVLGHNERIAWATTNALTAATSVSSIHHFHPRRWTTEVFHVRLAPDVVRRYYRTADGVAVPSDADGLVFSRWLPYRSTVSPLHTILQLNQAASCTDALHVLRDYEGTAQNFIIADITGAVAYHLAGRIVDDPAWGRYVHTERDFTAVHAVPFAALPAVMPSRSAVLVSANNKMYEDGYPYRLSAMFAPPYRAYRIAQLLHARRRFDAAYFRMMQGDVISPADAQFAHRVAAVADANPTGVSRSVRDALRSWGGSYEASSTVASLEHALRGAIEEQAVSPYAPFQPLSADSRNSVLWALRAWSTWRPWSSAGKVAVLHPLGSGPLAFLNAGQLPGSGDEYTIHVQSGLLTQSFRAVWDVGNWESGGIILPSGESGVRRSPYYADQRSGWVANELLPLPFSAAGVLQHARERVTIRPR